MEDKNIKQKDWLDKAQEKFFNKNYEHAEKLLLGALEAKDDNPIDRHFVYSLYIKLYYKLRNERKDAIDKCIYYCNEDIKNLPIFLEAYQKAGNPLPACESVERLLIIYEAVGEFQKAINLCNYVIKLGLQNRNDWYESQYKKKAKGDFRQRLERLERKLKK